MQIQPVSHQSVSSLSSLSVVQVVLSGFVCLLHSGGIILCLEESLSDDVNLLKVRKKGSTTIACPSTAVACYGMVASYSNSNVFQHSSDSAELLGSCLLF